MERPAPVDLPPHVAEGRELLARLLAGMGVEADLEVLRRQDRHVLSVSGGSDESVIIGRKGATLDALQLVVNRILHHRHPEQEPIVVDVSGYRERRRRNLAETANRAAERVRQTGRAVLLGSYGAYERHLIHAALQDDPDVLTESQGEGPHKRILCRPRPASPTPERE